MTVHLAQSLRLVVLAASLGFTVASTGFAQQFRDQTSRSGRQRMSAADQVAGGSSITGQAAAVQAWWCNAGRDSPGAVPITLAGRCPSPIGQRRAVVIPEALAMCYLNNNSAARSTRSSCRFTNAGNLVQQRGPTCRRSVRQRVGLTIDGPPVCSSMAPSVSYRPCRKTPRDTDDTKPRGSRHGDETSAP